MHKLISVLVLSCATTLGIAQDIGKPAKPTHIICTIPKGKITKMVKPVYPADAKSKNIFGPVRIQAIIDKQGLPTNLKIVSGDPVLAKAALDAIRKWHYKPYKLNGVPAEVETTITVRFEPGPS